MKKLTLLALLTLFLSCGNHKEDKSLVNVSVNLDTAQDVTIGDIVWLETSDSAMIYDISNLFPMEDEYVIQSRSFIKIFDTDGNYQGEMAVKGQGPGEFNWIGNVWADDTVFYLADGGHSAKKILQYDKNGTFLGESPLFKSNEEEQEAWTPDTYFNPTEIYVTPNEGIYYVNGFLGGAETGPYAMAYTADKDTEPHLIHGLRRTDGNSFYNRVTIVPSSNEAIYWEHFKDTVYLCSPDTIRPWIALDYGKYTMPEEVSSLSDSFHRARKLEELEDKNDESNYAAPNRYFQFADGNLYYMTAMGDNIYIVNLKPDNYSTTVNRITIPEGSTIKPQLFFKIIGDEVLVSVIDEGNPDRNGGIAKLKLSDLK